MEVLLISSYRFIKVLVEGEHIAAGVQYVLVVRWKQGCVVVDRGQGSCEIALVSVCIGKLEVNARLAFVEPHGVLKNLDRLDGLEGIEVGPSQFVTRLGLTRIFPDGGL